MFCIDILNLICWTCWLHDSFDLSYFGAAHKSSCIVLIWKCTAPECDLALLFHYTEQHMDICVIHTLSESHPQGTKLYCFFILFAMFWFEPLFGNYSRLFAGLWNSTMYQMQYMSVFDFHKKKNRLGVQRAFTIKYDVKGGWDKEMAGPLCYSTSPLNHFKRV